MAELEGPEHRFRPPGHGPVPADENPDGVGRGSFSDPRPRGHGHPRGVRNRRVRIEVPLLASEVAGEEPRLPLLPPLFSLLPLLPRLPVQARGQATCVH